MPASDKNLYLDPYRSVRLWLYCLAVLVAGMVLVGGATRLTDSGLSITEWAPIRGFMPPLSLADWESEFIAYQTTAEFKQQNSLMTLDQFKMIYWWEWGHRFLGRITGLAVLLPMIFFWARGNLNRWLKPAVLFLFALVSFQGFLGWWMVKSGLADRVDVSQIRLAVHLVAACILLIAVIWVARSLARHTHSKSLTGQWQGGGLVLLVLIQIFLGGLVAGLDAGMAYNTWPTMNGEWVPEGMWILQPAWTNLTDNALTVQFVHRITAYFLWIVCLFHAVVVSRREPITTHGRRAWMLFLLVSVQALIGIMTLLLQVPISWGLFHQTGGIIVLAFATAHWRALKPKDEIKEVSMV
ncbi:MAG: COX15/CtaA family protein [Rhizobiaceae bacterium]